MRFFLTPDWPGIRALGLLATLLVAGCAAPAYGGQISAMLSPGPLARAHQRLEGISKCVECHEAGQRVTVEKCLTCHLPIADRIRQKTGVHRTAGNGCVTCHVEHAGEAADLRHFDVKTFDHAKDTRFPLDGLHAKAAANCAACHKTRSFLTAKSTCVSCHTDVHKGSLGTQCTTCHSTRDAFKAARTNFDHGKTRFALTGAHTRAACESCHKGGVFRGVVFASCTSCHTDPHKQAFGATCTTCHTTERWATRSVDHGRTGFPLVGAHTTVDCVKCHRSGEMTEPIRFDTCAACHANVHRASIKDDCRTCHTEASFKGATFDHAARTTFAIDGKHIDLACVKCHTAVSAPEVPLAAKVLDYSGASRECVTCHGPKDPHKGDFGRACDSCHKTATFDTKTFVHAGAAEFYRASHDKVTCEKCHVPARTPNAAGLAYPKPGCVTCHKDAHLGQLAEACESCHTVDGPHFKALRFTHQRATFALTGRHETTECVKCHKTETRAFPAGTGAAMVLKPIDAACRACHVDVHLGQVDQKCEACHQTRAFKIFVYTHKGLEDFFAGVHGKYACADCHKKAEGVYPAGRGVAVKFRVGRDCASCHAK